LSTNHQRAQIVGSVEDDSRITYSNQQGRFTSVDPLGKSANVLKPQSFNRHAYVSLPFLNNHVNRIGPTPYLRLSFLLAFH